MKLPLKNRIRINYPLLAFLFPVLAMLCVMLCGGYEPFGNNRSMLYSDMYHQYYPFFVSFRKALLSGDSLLYNWEIGMGLDHLGLISYYLASPLNLLGVLVPESLTLEYFALLMPIKLGLASLFFALFLKKLFDKNDLSIVLFGAMYGLCAWALGYQWNVMWLDTFALLPLMALGTILLLRDKKVVLYTVTLFLSIFSNYYIGFFVCIFVLLIFICYQICRCRSVKRLVLDFGRIGFFTVFAIGMTLVLTLPAYTALQTTQSSVNNFPETFQLNIADKNLYSSVNSAWNGCKNAFESLTNALVASFTESDSLPEALAQCRVVITTALGEDGLIIRIFARGWEAFSGAFLGILDGMRRVAGNMGGGLTPSFKEGLPNLYCGVGTIGLAFLFLTSSKAKVRDRLCSLALLLFFMLSFVVRQLDYIWHGFHFTNMIPYRFSFLFSFVLLYMAYRAWLQRETFKPWQLITAGVLTLGVLACSESITDIVFIAYNLVFLLLYLLVFGYSMAKPKLPEEPTAEQIAAHNHTLLQNNRFSCTALAAIMALEIVFNVVNFGVNFPYTGISSYPKGTESTASIIRYMEDLEEDNLFYRTEVTHSQTLNDGALNGYHGISTFTSSANVKVTEFMQSLGYAAKNTWNRYCFEESSPVANLFLNLKYMIERDGRVEANAYFDEVRSFDNVYLLENNAYLPLGFMTSSALGKMEFSTSGDAFSFQNKLLKTAAGIDEDVWYKLTGDALSLEIFEAEFTTTPGSTGYSSYQAGAEGGAVVYNFTADRDGFACIHLNLPKKNSYSVSVNDVELYTETYSLPQMLSVSDVNAGDVISIRFTCKANEKGTITATAAVLDETVFRKAYDILNTSTLTLTDFENTLVEGTIHCESAGLLYTSIPQDGNWTAQVDGEDAEIVLVGDAMVALELTEGDHVITFRYRNKAFSLGWKISLVCLAAFVAVTLILYRPGKRKGHYEKRST